MKLHTYSFPSAATALILSAGLVCISCLFACKTTPPQLVEITTPEQAHQAETPVDFAGMLDALLQRGDINGALDLYTYMPESMQTDYELQLLHVSLYISAQRYADAELLVQQLKTEHQADADLHYLEAMIFRATGNNKKYESSLKTVLKTDAAHGAALAEMGSLMYAQRNWKKADEYFKKSLAVNPSDPAALYGLARVQYRSEQYEESEATLTQALKVDPSNDIGFADRAKARIARGNIKGAIEDITKALEIRPQDSYYWYDLGRYELKRKNRTQALSAFDKSIECNPDYYLSYVYRAGMRDENGDFSGAADDYRMIIKLNPQYYFAAESLGVILWHMGQYAECREQFGTALQFQSTDVSYIMMYCACLQREGKQKDIQEFLRGILPSQNRESLEYYLMRLYNDRAGENDIFIRIQKEKSVDKKAKAYFYLAAYYEGAGNTDMADKCYLEAHAKVIQPAYFESRLIDWAMQARGLQPQN